MGLFDFLRKLMGGRDDDAFERQYRGDPRKPRRYGDAGGDESPAGREAVKPEKRLRETKPHRYTPRRGQAAADGGVLDVDELCRRLDKPRYQLERVEIGYREFHIPKRSGGQRPIAAPHKPLKTLQRRLLRRVFARLKAHAATNAFEKDRSIVTNAARHLGRAVVIKMDVQNFFNSTTALRVNEYFKAIGWDADAATLLTRLTTYRDGLPQGAPTSPRLSNLVNYQLDARLEALAAKFEGRYTRYADDITFSFDDHGPRPNAIIHLTKRILDEYGYRLHTDKKLRVMRQHDRQQVTGLVVNERVNLPRSTRRWLRAVEHHLRTGQTATLTEQQLEGWRAFENMVQAKAMR